MARWARWIGVWAFSVAYWLAIALAQVATLRAFQARLLHRIARFWGRVSLAMLGIQLEVEGIERLSTRAPRVIVVNHQSALDLFWGAAICPPAPFAIGKKEILWIPLLNLLWWAFGFIRIDRSNHERALAAISGVANLVRAHRLSLFIAPEGTRSPDGRLGEFKKGAFHIARQAGVPVVPVVVRGAYELMPKQAWFPRPGRLRLLILPNLHPGTFPDADSLSVAARSAIASEYERIPI